MAMNPKAGSATTPGAKNTLKAAPALSTPKQFRTEDGAILKMDMADLRVSGSETPSDPRDPKSPQTA